MNCCCSLTMLIEMIHQTTNIFNRKKQKQDFASVLLVISDPYVTLFHLFLVFKRKLCRNVQ